MSDDTEDLTEAAKAETAFGKGFSAFEIWLIKIAKICTAIAVIFGSISFLYPLVFGFVWSWRESLSRAGIVAVPPLFTAFAIWRVAKYMFSVTCETIDWKKLGRLTHLLLIGIALHASAFVVCLMAAVSTSIANKSFFLPDSIVWMIMATSILVDGAMMLVLPLICLYLILIVAVERIKNVTIPALLKVSGSESAPVVKAQVPEPCMPEKRKTRTKKP